MVQHADNVHSCPAGNSGTPTINPRGPGAWYKGQTVVLSRSQKGSVTLRMSLFYPRPQFPPLKNVSCIPWTGCPLIFNMSLQTHSVPAACGHTFHSTNILRSYYVPCTMYRVGNADTGKMHPQLCPGQPGFQRKEAQVLRQTGLRCPSCSSWLQWAVTDSLRGSLSSSAERTAIPTWRGRCEKSHKGCMGDTKAEHPSRPLGQHIVNAHCYLTILNLLPKDEEKGPWILPQEVR